jgi:hypothetical protein
MTPTAEFQLEFLSYLQRIFDEGDFSATYKFALLMALADLAVETGDDTGDELDIDVKDIARKFIGYYERQARPFPASGWDDEPAVIHQNTGGQAAIITSVREADSVYGPKLVNRVAATIKVQPLWRLQILSGDVVDFLYPNIGRGDTIRLKPGIMFCFRRFHGFVHDLARTRWIAFVRERPQNLELLGVNVDLSEFMFGSTRSSLAVYRPVLADVQRGLCFYCSRDLRTSEVDHFVPWSKYGADLGHNFVLACRACNNAKRDLLAAEPHLERWARRNDDHGAALASYFQSEQVVHDIGSSRMITRWAYGQAAMSNARVWVGPGETTRLSPRWPLYFTARH